MSAAARKLQLITIGLPAYRAAFVEQILDWRGGEPAILAGDEFFERGAVTELPDRPEVGSLKNRFLFGRRLLWQSGGLRRAIAADVTVADLNPRIVSNWVLLIARRVLGRRTVLWGHAWPRAGRESRSTRLRMAMCRLANAVLVYTESDRAELAAQLEGRPVFTAPNAIYRAEDMRAIEPQGAPCDFVFSGRLVAEKKPALALEAFASTAPRLDPSAGLLFIGDGPLRASLEARAAELGVKVRFLGSVFALDELRAAYASALATLSPGYVGLAMTQSHSFGIPMIYAADEPHAPEIEAAREGVNSVSFESDDAEALASAMAAVWNDRAGWLARRDEIARGCRESYSAEVMARGFLQAVEAG